MADTKQQIASGASAPDEPEGTTYLRLSSKDKGEDVEMVTLFEIDDVKYEVPQNPSPTVGLRYLHILNDEGEQKAAYFILTKMLSEEGYEALMNYEQLSQDQYDFVLTAAVRIATGKTERPKGTTRRQNGRSGRRN